MSTCYMSEERGKTLAPNFPRDCHLSTYLAPQNVASCPPLPNFEAKSDSPVSRISFSRAYIPLPKKNQWEQFFAPGVTKSCTNLLRLCLHVTKVVCWYTRTTYEKIGRPLPYSLICMPIHAHTCPEDRIFIILSVGLMKSMGNEAASGLQECSRYSACPPLHDREIFVPCEWPPKKLSPFCGVITVLLPHMIRCGGKRRFESLTNILIIKVLYQKSY